MAVPQHFPFGPGYDEVTATLYATELARLLDQLHAAARYIDDTYSPYAAADIALYWAQVPGASRPGEPTDLQLEKADEFKAWLGAVQSLVQTAFAGEVGAQIRRWRSAAPSAAIR